MNLATMAAGANGPPLSFPAYITNMVKTQGVMSLYSGLSAGLLRQCFYATSRVGFFELLRDEMAKYRPTDFLSRLIVGVVSGGMAAVISCPAEVTLVRMSNDATMEPAKRRNYTGVSNAFARILREEGVKTFFTGSVHTHLILLASYLSLPIPAILRVKTFFTGSVINVMPYTQMLLASYLYLFAHSGYLLLSVSHALALALSSLAPPPPSLMDRSGPFVNRAMLVGAVQVHIHHITSHALSTHFLNQSYPILNSS